MNFLDIWTMKDWSDAKALSVALEAVERNGREKALVEWVDAAVPDSDFLGVVEDLGLTDGEAVAVILAFAQSTDFEAKIDAHARRVARKEVADPDHYGV